ncbi:MAG: leucyl aminopeptidase [Acidimicrobiales bacterium]
MASYGPDLKLAGTTPRGATAVGVMVDGVDELSPDRSRYADASGFEGKVGQTLTVPNQDGPLEVLVGLGSEAETTSVDDVRQAAASFARAVSRQSNVALVLGDGADPEHVTAAAEGAGLASYRYTAQKGKGTSPQSGTSRITIVARGKGVAAGFALAAQMVASVALTRDLVNEPGGSLLPTAFVKAARAAVRGSDQLKATVWDENRIKKEKLGGIQFVNKGSTHPPRLLVLSYTPAKKVNGAKHVALVGKGITFDSGGLSLKTGTGMMTMKVDMAGGAAVLGAMTMLDAMGCPNPVTALVPLTDNMPSGDAGRPGDVFTARNGKTVEVLNTDAEGRLVLADALSLAAEKKPAVIVDIATLTGSVTAALGAKFTGVMGNDDEVVSAVQAAASASGENVWHLPLPSEYRKDLDSDVADLRNIGKGPYGGALTAGLFLKEFVDDIPWAHLDLGLAALADSDDGVFTKGATGAGARTLARFATEF